ncbi:unnamed protein product [Nippostrongylus brasiliensis]|uniref:Serpentine receptor class gamma n=1 Tax=Nippostrongylus brasiliensis TaxID=27835 RepID=A0A0N4YB44_NIPBR|nr:unnamed protein product [Nippostrongylus brasiliensis]
MSFNCSVPIGPLTGTARIVYGASLMATSVVSFGFQAVLAVLTGTIYYGCFFSFVMSNFCLTAHRLVYTLFPVIAHKVLSKTIGKVCISSIFIFLLVYFIVSMTPLGSTVFCEGLFRFRNEKRLLKPVVSVMNEVSNYLVGIVNVSAYFVIFTTLYIKGRLNFKRNRALRMTVQVAVVSVLELIFYAYWQYRPRLGAPTWRKIMDQFSVVLYYDVLMLPYVVLNRRKAKDVMRLRNLLTSSQDRFEFIMM